MADPSSSSDGYFLEAVMGAVTVLSAALAAMWKLDRDDQEKRVNDQKEQGKLAWDIIERRIEADHALTDAVRELTDQQRQTREEYQKTREVLNQVLFRFCDANGFQNNGSGQH